MLATRELTQQEMALVAGGGFLTSDPGPGCGNWFGSTSNPFDVAFGTTAGGWNYGASYANGQLGIWTQSPSGLTEFHAFQNDASGTMCIPIDSGTITFGVDYSNTGGASGGVQIEWHF